MVRSAGCKTAREAIDYLLVRFISVPVDAGIRDQMVAMLEVDLGTANLRLADTYMEDALRNALHVILSQPSYQLG
jgi:hypothetical protein